MLDWRSGDYQTMVDKMNKMLNIPDSKLRNFCHPNYNNLPQAPEHIFGSMYNVPEKNVNVVICICTLEYGIHKQFGILN